MLKKFMSYYKPHLRLFTIDMICALFVAICNIVYPMIAQLIVDKYSVEKDWQMIIILCSILLGIYIIKAFLNFVIQYWGHIVGVRIQGDMRKDLFTHLQSLPFSYLDENKTGTIMSRIINDLMDISELAHHGPEDLFLSVISLIGAFVMMVIFVDYRLTLIVFVIIPFIVLFAIQRRKKMRDAFSEMRIKTGEINAEVESSISGIRVSRAYNAKNYEEQKFEKANTNFKQARAMAYKQMGIFGSGMSFFTDFLYLVIIVSSGLFLCFDLIGPGQFTAAILYITMIISPIRTLIAIYEQIQSGMTGFARFQEIMNEEMEKECDNPITLESFKSDITFDNVSFKYKSRDALADDEQSLVLKDLSFTIKKGTTLALVGPSGGGKTTICHLIPRFYEILDGKITIDGTDIRTYSLSSLRQNIGIVTQDVFLFGGTVRENIAYGNLNASDEEIIEAAKSANIHDFIMTLENGYDTYVGERGIKLSGGQKQRISIARAFLKNPPILILDEATSALDTISEMMIQQSLEKLSIGRTTIVVAHRLSTVKNADEIIVITKDGIVERGTHDELLQKDGLYHQLYQYQFKDEKN